MGDHRVATQRKDTQVGAPKVPAPMWGIGIDQGLVPQHPGGESTLSYPDLHGMAISLFLIFFNVIHLLRHISFSFVVSSKF